MLRCSNDMRQSLQKVTIFDRFSGMNISSVESENFEKAATKLDKKANCTLTN